ncbi:hypothetical protein BGX31_000300 [Mortierella sp. GBA43]|nr:hypothetical protein BGX31_000300 [Mortierella sp. GBA43]
MVSGLPALIKKTKGIVACDLKKKKNCQVDLLSLHFGLFENTLLQRYSDKNPKGRHRGSHNYKVEQASRSAKHQNRYPNREQPS